MTAVAITCAILFEIVLLVGVWYNGRNHGRTQANAETTQVGADVAAERAKQVEAQLAKEHDDAVQKDLDDAKKVTTGDDAADFFLRSHKDR